MTQSENFWIYLRMHALDRIRTCDSRVCSALNRMFEQVGTSVNLLDLYSGGTRFDSKLV
jgi:hypothetical protein